MIRSLVILVSCVAAISGSAATAVEIRSFAKIPGDNWTISAFTADGKTLLHCTATRRGSKIPMFVADQGGFALVLRDEAFQKEAPKTVHLTAGKVIDGDFATRVIAPAEQTIVIGKTRKDIEPLLQAVHRNKVQSLSISFGDQAIKVSLKYAADALVELNTCLKNARPN